MGRSVAKPSNAIVVCYQSLEAFDENDQAREFESFDWDMFVEDIEESCISEWDSFSKVKNKWLDRENHILLENRFAYIGVSEYCGLASIWIVAKDDENFAIAFCNKIAPKFNKMFGNIVKVGSFSNGESVYEKKIS